jgi:hypothetical protein
VEFALNAYRAGPRLFVLLALGEGGRETFEDHQGMSKRMNQKAPTPDITVTITKVEL